MDEGLKAWLGPAYAELTADQLESVERMARELERTFPSPDEAAHREARLNLHVQSLLVPEPVKEHRYMISYAIIVNNAPGTGSFTVKLDHVLDERDLRELMADQREEAVKAGFRDASMPNVTSIWKFED